MKKEEKLADSGPNIFVNVNEEKGQRPTKAGGNR